ncbi:murein biosynthesis integral membrane protein MurJ [Gemmatimonas phototrophica]|uniref:Virulence factor MviN n=1 Tax=Gemmatimonas phototrophica TaxID=1379270 RepID=A0A143BKS3_9BACT|nr:lipid II flippase MurJ [Gemmatimonas phototrophica]AMW05618.1 hypothetical protein GEMMAAP_14015 [Gemmatimonas phototrophica]
MRELLSPAHAVSQHVHRRLGPLWSAAAVIGILTLGGKAIGLVKEMLVAARFGTAPELDALLMALAIPTFAINVVVGVLPMALTPAFVAARTRGGLTEARQLAGTAFRQTYRVMLVLAFALAALTVLLAELPGSGLSDIARQRIPLMAAILIPFTFLQGASAAWTGILAADGAFAVGALATASLPTMMLLSVLAFSDSLGVTAIAVGLVAGCVTQALLLGLTLRHRGLSLWERNASLQAVNRQYIPAIAGAIFTSSCGLIDQIMASALPSGAVSTLSYAGKLVAVGLGIAIVAIGTPLLPHVSRLVEQGEWLALRTFQRRASLVVLAVTVPSSILLAFVSEPIVRIAFERGAFSANDTAQVALVQSYYMLQIPGQFLAVIYARSLAAMRMTSRIGSVALVSLFVNVIGNLYFMRRMGAPGIALSTATVQTVSALLLFVLCERLLRERLRDGDPQFPSLAPVVAPPTS